MSAFIYAQKVSDPCTCQAVVMLVKALASLLTKLPLLGEPVGEAAVAVAPEDVASKARASASFSTAAGAAGQPAFRQSPAASHRVAHLLGYSTLASFSAWYRGRFDETPTRARRRQWQPEERGRLERQ